MNNHLPTNYVSAARAACRLSQRDLARLTGLSQVGICHIENRPGRKPHATSKRVIAQALGFSEADLFPPPGKRSPSPELRAWAKALSRNGGGR